MIGQNDNYGQMGAGIDRITQILQRQSQPVSSSPIESEATTLPTNILNALAVDSYDYGDGAGGNFVKNVQKFQSDREANELDRQQGILKAYEMKLRLGDAQTKALDDKITMFTGNDPDGKAMFLQALHEDPDSIDPTNSYQVMTKLAGIKKRLGYESPDMQMARQKDQLDIAFKKAQINATNALANKRNEPPSTAPDFKAANTLRDEFNSLTKDFRSVQDAYSKIRKTSNTGAGDMSMLYQYVKLLDPGSVVRESEFATAAASGSYGERIAGAVKGITSGGRLSNALRNEFLNEADNVYQGQKAGYDRQKAIYTDISNKFNVDPTLVVTDYTDATPGSSQATGADPLGIRN